MTRYNQSPPKSTSSRRGGPSRVARAKNSPRSTGVQVIARAAEVLRVLADAQGLSLSHIASAVGLARSTVHRIVLALEKEGLVVSNGPGGYRLGPSVAALAEACKFTAIHDLHPHLVRLSKEVNETVDLSILTGHSITFVDQVSGTHRLQAVSHIGASFPLHCTANGKSVLARLPAERVRSLLPKRLEQFTPATTGSRDLLEKELRQIRRAGIAFDREEYTVGICAVGASLQLATGEIIAISIPLPAERFRGREKHLADALRKHCAEVSKSFPMFGSPELE